MDGDLKLHIQLSIVNDMKRDLSQQV